MLWIFATVGKLARRAVPGGSPTRALRRLAGDRRGATAVEFALVALPFFALMFAIIETALDFFANQVLETAVANTAREIRTGQLQQAGASGDDFKTAVCGQVSFLFNCSNLYLDVRTYANFGDISLGIPVDAHGNLKTDGYTYDAGSGGSIVVVRAYYEWPVFVNRLGNDMGNMPDGNHLLVATAAFQNEPFPW